MERNDIGQIIRIDMNAFEVIHDEKFEAMVVKETDYEPKEGYDTPEQWRKELESRFFIQNFENQLNAYEEDGWWWFKGNETQDQLTKQEFEMKFESETIDGQSYMLNFKVKDEIWEDMKL